MSYKVKVKKIGIVNEAGDRVVLLTCYLVDSLGVALQAVDGSITFDVRVPKSKIPTLNLPSDLIGLVKNQIAVKYNRYLTVTYTPTHASNRLLFSSTDVSKLFTGLTVTGPGIPTSYFSTSATGNTTVSSGIITSIATYGIVSGMLITGTGIPSGTFVSTVSPSSITISQNATVTGTGTFVFSSPTILNSITTPTEIQLSIPLVLQLASATVSPSLTATGNTTIDSFTYTGNTTINNSTISGITTTAGIMPGMTITGAGISSSTTVLTVLTNSITISQNATATATGVTLTFSGYTYSNVITGMSSTTNIATGMSISGTSIPYGSTVLTINSSTSITINQKATAINTGITFTFSTVANSIYLNLSTFTFTGNTINGSNVITNMSGVSNIVAGTLISGTGIPASSFVLSVSSTSITISQNATATNTGTTFTFTPSYFNSTIYEGLSISGFSSPIILDGRRSENKTT